jgi:hypothetical protein
VVAVISGKVFFFSYLAWDNKEEKETFWEFIALSHGNDKIEFAEQKLDEERQFFGDKKTYIGIMKTKRCN